MSHLPDFKTERLSVTPWSGTDLERLNRKALSSILTPNVLKHLPAPLQFDATTQTIDDWISARLAESDLLAIRTNDPSALIGLLILARFQEPPQPPQIHLGYLLGENAWGKGYATELVAGLVAWYRAQPRPAHLWGGVETANPASAKVLQKAGFQREEGEAAEGTEMYNLVI